MIKSTFYDTLPGEGVKETQWAESAVSRGATYGVIDTNGLALTPHLSTPYTLNIGPALSGFFGRGVWDTSDTTVTLPSVTPPATGAKRWDMVAARRDWSPTGGGPTVLTVVQGSATRALPTGRQSNPGQVDDQPLWLVEWTGGQTQPTGIIDLRCWAGNGGLIATNEIALQYLATPGARVTINGALWQYEPVGNGNWGWVHQNPLVHLELTTQQGKNLANQPFGPGTTEKLKAGINTNRSFNSNQFTIGPADRISVNQAGLYAISWMIFGMGNASGAIQLRVAATTAAHASLGFTAVSDVTITVPNIYLFAGDQIAFYFSTQQSVPSGHHVRFTKLR